MHVHCCCERSIHSNQWTARVCRRGNQQRVPGQRLRERHQMAEKRVCRVYGERSSVKGALGAPAPNPNLNPNPNTNPHNKRAETSAGAETPSAVDHGVAGIRPSTTIDDPCERSTRESFRASASSQWRPYYLSRCAW